MGRKLDPNKIKVNADKFDKKKKACISELLNFLDCLKVTMQKNDLNSNDSFRTLRKNQRIAELKRRS